MHRLWGSFVNERRMYEHVSIPSSRFAQKSPDELTPAAFGGMGLVVRAGFADLRRSH
jgi:hypothetical protein